MTALGDAMPVVEHRITAAGLMAYGASTWDWHRMHYDSDYARAHGLPGVVLDGQAYGAYFASAAMGWLGPRAFIRKLSFKMRSMTVPGDTLRCEGEVTAVEGDTITVSQRLMVDDRLAAEATTEIHVLG